MTTTDRELGGLVREWLRPGTTTLSEGVFTRAIAEVSTTPQRRGTLPLRRWFGAPWTSRFALVGSTAIVIVAVAGLGLLLAPPGPRVGPNVVTPAATPRPTASPSLVPDASRAVIDLSNGLRVTFDVPVGWSRYGAASVGTENPLAPAGAEVSFYEADAVFKDPCNLDLFITQISGPTAADLVDAFEKTGNYTISRLRDVQLGGYTGKGIDLTAPKDVDACPSSGFMMFADGGRVASASSNQRDSLWILDVADLRLVVDAVSFPGTPTDALVAQQQLLDSIRIERVAAAYPVSPSPSDNRGSWEAIDGLQITFDLPPGWSQPGGTGSTDRYPTPHVEGRNPGVAVNFYDEIDRVMPRPPTEPGVGPQDPKCRLPYGGNDDAGTTPADLAAKLQSDPDLAATKPVDVTLSGFNGKRLELQIPDPIDPDCHLSPGLTLWIGRPTGFAGAGQRDTVWILDVRGKRVLIEAVSFPGTSAEDLAAQQRLIDSIRIERTAP